MKNRILLRTNIMVCMIIIIGFLFTAVLSYRANYSTSVESIEQVTDLTSEGIYYQLSSIFAKPLNVSLTMANDSFLRDFLSDEDSHLDSREYIETMQEYLSSYQKKYNYDSVFLVSAGSGRYYNFNGVDRVLAPDDPENVWYYNMLKADGEYSLNVDNDEAESAENEITVFVNCKIRESGGNVVGIVGVGVRINYLQAILKQYEEEFGVNALLINEDGIVEISTEYTGYDRVSFFNREGGESLKGRILSWKEEGVSQNFWTSEKESRNYVVTRYIPELSWHLVVRRDTGILVRNIERQFFQTVVIIAAIIFTILFIITHVIRGFNQQIMSLIERQKETFRQATERQYDNIYELNITKNRAGGESTERYFLSLGVPPDTPYDQVLEVIAKKQIKEEFRDGYISTFSTQNVLKEYAMGNPHLRYDFMISENGSEYFWMRIDAHIYYGADDKAIRMFTYRKNIDAEKKKEVQVETDEMTQLFNRAATKRRIEDILAAETEKRYAFFIFDIDNFKQANDQYGHAFGDHVIAGFAKILKDHFHKGDIIGRIGGDEFVAFASAVDEDWAEEKACEVCRNLDRVFTWECSAWKMSASIGIGITPQAGKDFETLYKNADFALYQTKERGKKGYTLFKEVSLEKAEYGR